MAERRRIAERTVESLRIPPHSIQAEQSVLGGLMLDNQTWDVVVDRVVEEDFYRKDHRLIFRGIERLAGNQTPFDVVTLSEELNSAGLLAEAGGLAYLATLAKETPSAANIAAYADIVREKSVLRQLIHVGTEIADSGFNPENQELAALLESAESKVFRIADQKKRAGNGFTHVKGLLVAAIERVETLHNQSNHLTGASTGFTDLDEMTSGLQRSDLVIIAGRPSMGKAQPLDAKILMADGTWKLMGELRFGDRLASIDGKPSRVIGIYPQGRREVFRVAFADGRSAEACAEHLWTVRYRDWPESRTLSTARLHEMLRSVRYRNRLSIDKVSGDFGGGDMPLDPYVLGVLLGDGDLKTATPGLTSADPEIVCEMQRRLGASTELRVAAGAQYGYRLVCKGVVGRLTEVGSRAWIRRTVYPVARALSSMGLLGLGGEDKFIPEIYFSADRDARLDLLRGLMDTDGWAEKHAAVRFSSCSKRLAEGVQRLVRSLGGTCSIAIKKTKFRYKGETKNGLPAYICRIRYLQGQELFLLERKRVRAVRKKPNAVVNLNVASIALSRVAETQCIHITHPSRLYITDDYVVTHNTTLAMNIAENVAVGERTPVAVFSMEMPGEQLALRMMSSLGRIDQHRVRTGKLDDDEWPRMTSALNILADTKMFIDDTPALTPMEVRARCRRLAREHGPLGLVMLDYLQLMQGSGSSDNRTGEISEISRSLKALAKEMNVPVIALSQLNRNLEQRTNKRPMPSDLRESGCLTGDTLITHALTGATLSIKTLAERGEQTPLPVFAVDENQRVGVHSLTKAFYSGRKRVYALETCGGRLIKASANHPFLTPAGWRALEELRIGDPIGTPGREIRRLEASNVVWDAIADIRELGEEAVYDATVAGVHNFVANDLIVHNSIEQDADLIVFIYRDEVYNPESPDKGTAEIIIAKQRNGPIGTVKLHFNGHYTRFDNHADANAIDNAPPPTRPAFLDPVPSETSTSYGSLPSFADPADPMWQRR